MHIPPHLFLPQDMIDIVDRGPPDPGPQPEGDDLAWKIRAAGHDGYRDGPKVLRMHIVDAKHAMEVEPERYVLPSQRVAEPEAEPEEMEQTGADGPAWYPQGDET